MLDLYSNWTQRHWHRFSDTAAPIARDEGAIRARRHAAAEQNVIKQARAMVSALASGDRHRYMQVYPALRAAVTQLAHLEQEPLFQEANNG